MPVLNNINPLCSSICSTQSFPAALHETDSRPEQGTAEKVQPERIRRVRRRKRRKTSRNRRSMGPYLGNKKGNKSLYWAAWLLQAQNDKLACEISNLWKRWRVLPFTVAEPEWQHAVKMGYKFLIRQTQYNLWEQKHCCKPPQAWQKNHLPEMPDEETKKANHLGLTTMKLCWHLTPCRTGRARVLKQTVEENLLLKGLKAPFWPIISYIKRCFHRSHTPP